jgi:DNA-directed RNA polymerase subunit H (RpoH/RPB5)
MFINDPISKFYRARVGDVIMMKRKTGTTSTLIKEEITYRKVVYAISKEVRK